ncbi:MAG: ribonucleotide-diphosphate reductase subunit beta [Candidatus Colwellbacteria bacterium]|nr:ribonucleotide-diphosphate reductase subunit beta [Candidatus Colwellbacteria bacterium]
MSKFADNLGLTTDEQEMEFYLSDNKKWREQRYALERETEYLLDPAQKRDSLYPIVRQGIWTYYEKHNAAHWVASEIDLSKDKTDWETVLNDDERYYIKHGLAFFAGSDFIINENQGKDAEEVTSLEYNYFNHDKMAREDIHSITYANLLEEYVKDPVEKDKLKNAVTLIPAVKAKADWMREFIANGTFVERMVAGAIMEGIFFSATFCGIFWLRKRGLMSALCDANEFIARDEGVHRDFACYIYKDEIVNNLPEAAVIYMIKKAVKIEQNFVCDSLPVSLIGMNNNLMCQYVEYMADHLALNLIGKRIYNVEDPFSDWMAAILLKVKTDFFVHRPTAYGNSTVSAAKEDIKVRFDDMSF